MNRLKLHFIITLVSAVASLALSLSFYAYGQFDKSTFWLVVCLFWYTYLKDDLDEKQQELLSKQELLKQQVENLFSKVNNDREQKVQDS